MQPDAKLQEEAAKLLIEGREQRGESREELQAVIAPYEAYLKSKTKTILGEILESREQRVESNEQRVESKAVVIHLYTKNKVK